MKQIDRDALKEWEALKQSIYNDTPIDDSMSPAEIEKHRLYLEAHPIEWMQFFFPKYAKYPFAPFQKKAIRRIINNPEWYEVLSWSRSLAKSTITMFAVMYLTLTGRKSTVILASATEKAAARLLAPYRANLESNRRIIQYYGEQMSVGEWAELEFRTRQGVAFYGVGSGNAPRGARNEAIRPDVLLVDDFDTDEDCRNELTTKKKWDWFEQALYPTRSVSEDLLTVFCGNVIARNCCVACAGEKADSWEIINIRDAQGCSTWPEKNTEERIRRIESSISTRSFQQEYMNNPLSEGEVFKEMTWGPCPPLGKLPFVVVYGDPAPSNSRNKNSSYKACFLAGYYDGRFYVYTGRLDHVTNDEFVDWYYHLRDYAGERTQVYSFIENNKLQDPFYEQVFMPIFARKGAQQGFLGITPDERRKPDKFDRIEGNLEPLNRQGRLVLNSDEKDNPHMKRLAEQFLLLHRSMKSPADGPDCIEGAVWILNQKISTLSAGAVTVGKRRRNSKNY